MPKYWRFSFPSTELCEWCFGAGGRTGKRWNLRVFISPWNFSTRNFNCGSLWTRPWNPTQPKLSGLGVFLELVVAPSHLGDFIRVYSRDAGWVWGLCLLGHPLLRGCSTATPAGRALLSIFEDISVGVCSFPCLWKAAGLERCWHLIKKLWRRNTSAAAPSNWLWLLVDCSRICDSVKSYILEGLKIIRVFNHGLGMSGLYLCVSPSEGHLGEALR